MGIKAQPQLKSCKGMHTRAKIVKIEVENQK